MKLVIFIFLLSIPFFAQSQRINNPSFEGWHGEGRTPPSWENCGGYLSTPDTQPGAWGVRFPPDHGQTYLGLVFRDRDNGSFESVTQSLSYPFHRDSCYTLEVSLAFDPDYEDPNSRKPGILRIWGGNSPCATMELLWKSPLIYKKEWRTYVVSFSPSASYSSITLEGYFAAQSFYNGVVLIDNIRNIRANPKPRLSIGNDTIICGNQGFLIDASFANGPYLWQDGTTESKYRVTRPGKYWVEAFVNGCKASDTINIAFEEPLKVDLGPDITLCHGGERLLSINIPNAGFKWSDQSNSPSILIGKPGKYWVEVTRGACTQADTILVSQEGPLVVDLGPDVKLCEGEERLVSLNIPNATFKWSDQSTNPYLKISKPGEYWVEVARGGCTEKDFISISECKIFIPNIIPPNGDHLNDNFRVIDESNDSWALQVFNRYGNLIYTNKNYGNDWKGEGMGDGVFFYVLKSNTNSRVFKGNITIVH